MIFILSGEGPSDIGSSTNAQPFVSDAELKPGPMTAIVRLVADSQSEHTGYLLSEFFDSWLFVSKSEVNSRAKKLPPTLAGKKHGPGTGGFYRNALAFAAIALEQTTLTNQPFIAFCFVMQTARMVKNGKGK